MGFKFSFFLLHDLSLHISNKSSDYNNKNSIASSNKGVLSYWKTDKVCFCCRCRITFVFLCPDLERFDTKTVNIGNSVFFAVFEQDPATSKGRTTEGACQWVTIYLKTVKKYGTRTISPELFVHQFICQERV